MTSTEPTAVILRPGEGRTIDLGAFAMSLKAGGGETDGAFALLEASEPAGFGPPRHVHEDAAEAFYVLEGEYLIFVEERSFACPAGSFIYIPAGTEHGFRVGDVPSRKLNLYTPAAMVGYFDGLSEAIRDGLADDERLEEIATRHHMRILGPTPEGYLGRKAAPGIVRPGSADGPGRGSTLVRRAVGRPAPRGWVQAPRMLRKQSLQYTGLPLVGRNGTWASLPQFEHVAVNISRGPRSREP